jgi:uncharacterized membrane protein
MSQAFFQPSTLFTNRSLMEKLTTLGRLFFAIAMVVFGLQHCIHLNFVTRLVPPLPAWIPGHSLLAVLFGAFLIVAGLAIVIGKAARPMALLLGGLILLSFLLLYLPALLANLRDGGLWTRAGKAMALAGGSFLVAGSLPVGFRHRADSRAFIVRLLESLIPLGRFFLAAFLILGGIQHFIYVEFVTRLVPAWIPGQRFWTYFAACALIAGGIGIILPWTRRLAASMSAIMIFLWVVLLHIPRALASPHDANELTAVFEALAMSGMAILIAASGNARHR